METLKTDSIKENNEFKREVHNLYNNVNSILERIGTLQEEIEKHKVNLFLDIY